MKDYQFKHPVTKQWITIVAESFNRALAKLKEMAKA